MPLSTAKIEHVIYYMLENRSFDNVLGWLYDINKLPNDFCLISNPSQEHVPFYGLEDHKYFNSFPEDDTRHYISRPAGRADIPSPDPHEEFENVNVQLFYPKWKSPWLASPPSDITATMMRFLADYSTAKTHARFGNTIDKQQALQILKTYDKSELNILNTLAENFAVSDYWFSSVPTQTNSNRAFSVTGSSDGLVNNRGPLYGTAPDKFKGYTIWQALYENKFCSPEDWMIFYQDLLPTRDKQTGKIKLRGFSYTRDAFNIPNPNQHVDTFHLRFPG
ncbi:hypothetical protein C2W62_44930 [Candidatus Entotheonella serta]|nr:hypothetical protein C2W62_44930 [Candidatus Entotheonella serta]